MYNNDDNFLSTFWHTTIFLLKSLVIAIGIFFSSHIDDDFNHIGKIRLASQSFSMIGYTFFFTVPPFVSAQVIKCGAQGKVTQQDQKKKKTHTL